MKPTLSNNLLSQGKTQNQGKEEEKFYDELDNRRAHSSCCTCQTLIILFIALLIIALGALLFCYWQLTHGLTINFPKLKTPAITFEDTIKNLPSNQDSLRLTLSSDDLSTLLNTGYSAENFVVKDIRSEINENNILIYGTLIKPMNSKIVLTTIPTVQNGKIHINVTHISAGKLNLPKYFNKKASEDASNLLDQKMAILYKKYIIQNVELNNNNMYIVGKLK